MPIRNKNIVITGAGSGIGKELVAQLSTFNNHILAVDIDLDNLRELKNNYPEFEFLCFESFSWSTGLYRFLNLFILNWKEINLIIGPTKPKICDPVYLILQFSEEKVKLPLTT